MIRIDLVVLRGGDGFRIVDGLIDFTEYVVTPIAYGGPDA